MQFYSPGYLNLLWLVPFLIFFFVASSWLRDKRIQALLMTTEIREKLLPHYEKNEWPIRAVFLLGAFIFAVLALSQPQWGEEKKKIVRKGVDIIFMLDVSTSMLAEDIKPNRVQKAKFEIEAFVKGLKGDRVGMLTFAGSSFMQTPLTLDYSAFLTFLSGVDVGHVPDPGTSLGSAIQRAVDAFPTEKGKYQAIIVFSDGEDHEAQLDPAVEVALKKNVRIYSIGTGTVAGAPIPLKDERGNQTAVKKDRQGQIVITKLNNEILGKVSSKTGGIYLPATPTEKEIALILKHMQTLGEKKLEDRLVTEREDHFQVFVFLAILCLMLEMLVRRAKSARAIALSGLGFIFIFNCGFISTPQKKVEEGNKDFEEKRYQSAVQKYRDVQVENPDTPAVEYNLATSLYKIEQYQEAAAHLKTAVGKSTQTPELQAKAAYNYGNALYRVGDYEGAIQAYKKALELNPQDKDAKYNIEFLQDKKSKFDKQNQDRKKNNPDQKQDKNDSKDKDQQNQGGGNNQDQNQNSSGQKNDQNQSGGGGSSQNKDQGQNNQNQQGSGKENQNQNQGGEGQQNEQNSGQNQDPQQKDQGQGQNQPDQNQSSGNQSEDQKEKNQGGKGEQDQNQPQQKDEQGQQNNKSDSDSQNQNQKESDQQQQQQPDSGQDQKEQNSPEQKQGDNQSEQPRPEQGKESPQPGAGQNPASGGIGSDSQQGSSGANGKPLQGQMTKEDAEYLLGSLEEGEKKMHVMRKPAKPPEEQPYVEKDW